MNFIDEEQVKRGIEVPKGFKKLDKDTHPYPSWCKQAVSILAKMYGKYANVLTTGVAYVEPAVLEADWMPEIGHGINAAGLMQLQLDAIKFRNSKVLKARDKFPAMFEHLLELIGNNALGRVMAHNAWQNAELEKDPNALAIIIRETHEIAALGPGMEQIEIRRLIKEMENFEQLPDQSVDEFKIEYDLKRRGLTMAGVIAPDPAQEAIIFLDKLDTSRYTGFNVIMRNLARAGGAPLPVTLQDAYVRARDYEVIPRRTKKQASATTFVTNAENRVVGVTVNLKMTRVGVAVNAGAEGAIVLILLIHVW